MNNLEELTAAIRQRATAISPIGHRLKWNMGDVGKLLMDGTDSENVISNTDGEAVATIVADFDTVKSIVIKEMTASGAYFQGKLHVEGDLAVAMQLEEMFQ